MRQAVSLSFVRGHMALTMRAAAKAMGLSLQPWRAQRVRLTLIYPGPPFRPPRGSRKEFSSAWHRRCTS